MQPIQHLTDPWYVWAYCRFHWDCVAIDELGYEDISEFQTEGGGRKTASSPHCSLPSLSLLCPPQSTTSARIARQQQGSRQLVSKVHLFTSCLTPTPPWIILLHSPEVLSSTSPSLPISPLAVYHPLDLIFSQRSFSSPLYRRPRPPSVSARRRLLRRRLACCRACVLLVLGKEKGCYQEEEQDRVKG